MKSLKIAAIVFILSSCYDNSAIYNAKSGEIVISGNDTFLVRVDTFRVIESHRASPRNVLEEANPKFEHLTDRGKIFFLPYSRSKGDTILTRTLTRINK